MCVTLSYWVLGQKLARRQGGVGDLCGFMLVVISAQRGGLAWKNWWKNSFPRRRHFYCARGRRGSSSILLTRW